MVQRRSLALTPAAIRSLRKRNEIPFVRLPNGQLRFDPEELRVWARSEAA
jgi:hypothetical protein